MIASALITFDQRARQLMADILYPLVTQQEVDDLRAQTLANAARLARLEALARPRLNYLWQQAGGPIRGHELTPQELDAARAYFEQLRLNRQPKPAAPPLAAPPLEVKPNRASPWRPATEQEARTAFAKDFTNIQDCFDEIGDGLVVVTSTGSFRLAQPQIDSYVDHLTA